MEALAIRTQPSGKYIKFVVYLVAVVLVNMVGMTLFARIDLTTNHIFSLSKASKDAVGTLSEPLTIHVFFTQNLPAPYNGTERYLHDLLEEYATYGGKNFNYQFHDVSADAGGPDAASMGNQKLAESYGVYPVQVQAVENDEVKFQKAYMGMAFIHGDLVERIPAITSTDGLEYQITSVIQKMNRKVSALLRLKEPVQVKLYKSSSLDAIAPYLGLKTLPELKTHVEALVNKLNGQLYNKLSFSFLDPTQNPALETEVSKYQLVDLKWPALSSGKIAAGQGAVGIVVQYGKHFETIPMLQAIQIPVIGAQYQLEDMKSLEDDLNRQVETLIGINAEIGYLADHGTPNLYGSPMAQGQGAPEDVNTFRSLLSKTYTIKDVRLKDGPLSDNFNCLVIEGPTEPFSDYDLFQIDQYLMKGKNLAIFLDAFKEGPPQRNMFGSQGPQYLPLNTGLEKLLKHYGVSIEPAIVMDENSFRQQVPRQYGGGERKIYFAPIIQNDQIHKVFPFLKSIRGLVAYKMSPIEMNKETLSKNDITAQLLFSSSPKSWLMHAPLNLNPMFIQPPTSNAGMASQPLAYVLTGDFPSYFAGKPVPEKPQKAPETSSNAQNPEKKPEQTTSAPATPAQPADISKIQGGEQVIAKGKPGKIFIMASSEMLKDNILDEAGRTPNAMFILNMIDYLNNRQDDAIMRSKEQRFNPLVEISAPAKTIVKSVNIAGLPILVVLFGLGVWIRRKSRRRRIQLMFQSQEG